QTRHDRSHKYAIQITTDSPHWGGLSGCTFEEAKSWGKIHRRAGKVMCFADVTIALPIIVHALSEKFKRLTREVPVFDWNKEGVDISYEKMKL
ncbi:MAG: deoxyhypusine synthase family protein, partial [Hadesarchaea archaeon]|nr:deoxyhypusine synthase family protein [Hadesarchaea archaeon]